jgi:hypothetical protein
MSGMQRVKGGGVPKDLQQGQPKKSAFSERRISIAADIPLDLVRADELLTAFGRWATWRIKRRRCGSAEGAYRPPANDDDRRPAEVLLVEFDAMRVQRALSRVPDLQRVVLEILYVPRPWPPEAALRRLRIPPRLSQDRHLTGLRMFDSIHAATPKAHNRT